MTARTHGFTLIEAMLGMMVLLTAASFIAPMFTRDLILGRVLWERRLAIKFIETQLDLDCNAAQTSTNFDALIVTDTTPNAITTQPELVAASATWVRDVQPVDGDPNLKQVIVTVNWTSHGRDVEESNAPYYISRVGVCGTGT